MTVYEQIKTWNENCPPSTFVNFKTKLGDALTVTTAAAYFSMNSLQAVVPTQAFGEVPLESVKAVAISTLPEKVQAVLLNGDAS